MKEGRTRGMTAGQINKRDVKAVREKEYKNGKGIDERKKGNDLMAHALIK
jgi:hypothetical protein